MPGAPPPQRAADAAEDALHAGKWLQARGKASEVLAQAGAPQADVTRAFYVLLQVDFHTGRLTDLEEAAQYYGRDLRGLPVTVLLLWGVIALQMDAGPAAHRVLSAYTQRGGAPGPELPREDCLALSRLYALRVLRGACGDAAAAREWLEAGGAGLEGDQQRLLLEELEEAEAAAAAGEAAGDAGASAGPKQQGRAPGVAAGRAAADQGWENGGLGRPDQFFTVTGEIEEIEEWPSASAATQQQGGGGGGGGGARQQEEDGGGGPAGGGGTRGAAAAAWEWASRAAARCRDAPVVQDALKALGLEEVPAWQLAAGGAVAALVAFSLYRERRAVRRAAAGLAGGAAGALAQVAAMATGFEPNAMAAAPNARAYGG